MKQQKKYKEKFAPDEVYLPGLAFYMPFPIERCCVKESSQLREVRNGAVCSESTRYADQMIVSSTE